jgi:dihydroflavonol-4-reductase
MTALLVTGATGFLGEHLVRVLVGEGRAVRTLARSASPILDDLAHGGAPIEAIAGDVTGPATELVAAVRGAAGVFHLAGMVSRDPADGQRMMRVHVDGTRNLLAACAEAGVKRVVLASSSGTVAVSKTEKVHDESSGWAEEVVAGWPYYASKIYQEKAALEMGRKLGIEVVVVAPSLLLGPGDRRLSSTKDVLHFLDGKIPIVPPGGINFVDVRDAAAATAAAFDRGRPFERYLLGGPNWTFAEFFGRLSRIAKVSPPRLRMPSALARWGASAVEKLYDLAGRESPIDRVSVEMSEHWWWIDSSKAARELGFAARDAAETLDDTVRYLRRGRA